jgi:hypothetical protein
MHSKSIAMIFNLKIYVKDITERKSVSVKAFRNTDTKLQEFVASSYYDTIF